MCLDDTYSADTEFAKLVARGSQVNLTLIALELARDANPRLSFGQTLHWIQERADELSGPVARAKTARDALAEVSHCLAITHGIHGDSAAYSSSGSSYLPTVIASRRGIPISLSLLYMAVADEVGLELQGIAAPMHFLTRQETSLEPLYVDAFSHGRIMTESECLTWLESLTEYSQEELRNTLQPATPRTIVLRMLTNLKYLHAQQENWNAAWMVQHRLVALQPSSYAEQRDLGLISLKAGRPGAAMEILESCLQRCPEQDQNVITDHLQHAKSSLARLN